jgi:hypothetical protein
MKSFLGLVLLGLSITIGTANALPIFSHTTDGSLFTISVDGRDEPVGLGGISVDSIIGTAIGSDTGINYPNSFSIIDSNSDNWLQFTFFNTSNLIEITGIASYINETMEAFTYSLAGAVDPTPPGPGPAPIPSIPEPATFLLLGAGLVGIGVIRRRKNRV